MCDSGNILAAVVCQPVAVQSLQHLVVELWVAAYAVHQVVNVITLCMLPIVWQLSGREVLDIGYFVFVFFFAESYLQIYLVGCQVVGVVVRIIQCCFIAYTEHIFCRHFNSHALERVLVHGIAGNQHAAVRFAVSIHKLASEFLGTIFLAQKSVMRVKRVVFRICIRDGVELGKYGPDEFYLLLVGVVFTAYCQKCSH